MMEFGPVYWDTNVFVALRETDGIENRLLWDILSAIRGKAVRFQTSALTFSELKVKPLRTGNEELLADYEAWSASATDWLQVWPVSKPVLEGAALLRAQKAALKLPDAIHLATALHVRCDSFLTADQGIQDIPTLEHPIEGALDIRPLKILRPDAPTLQSLIESLGR